MAISASSKWTMAHGHMLGMGGITTVDPTFEKNDSKDPNGQVLTLDRYKELTTNNNATFEFPKITEADVGDKSKGDFLSKLIAIVQTTWFILQCIARAEQHLDLTELELVTLALASLNAITYAFWWHKPLGVQEPVRIYFRDSEVGTEGPHNTEVTSQRSEISPYDVISKIGNGLKEVATNILDLLQDPCQGQDLCMGLFV